MKFNRLFRSGRMLAVGCALLLAAVVISSMHLEAAEPSSRLIDSGWEFRAAGDVEQTEAKEWHPAQVPGVVQTDLLRNKLIPDPFYRDNESRLQWIGLTDWEYRTKLSLDASTLAREHVDLVLQGLDTFADVYVNEQAVLHTDNMFRHWRIPAKPLLKPGDNALRLVFHSAVMKMLPYVKSLPYILPAISTINGGNEEGIPTAPYTRKAPYQYGWDWGPRFVTEGIWQAVRLEAWDAVQIENFHIHQVRVRATKHGFWQSSNSRAPDQPQLRSRSRTMNSRGQQTMMGRRRSDLMQV